MEKKKSKAGKFIIIGVVVVVVLFLMLLFSDDGDSSGTTADSSSSDSSSSYSGSASYDPDFTWGTCDSINGRTIVVSVFADDQNYSWDGVDPSEKQATIKNLGIATQFISENVAKYGANAEFIYDWNENPDLTYDAYINSVIFNGRGDIIATTATREYLLDNIDKEALLNKYNANNILFMLFVNCYEESNNESYTSYAYSSNHWIDVEYCNIAMYDSNGYNSPATYAHEMLHAFGAIDYYLESDIIPQAYVDEMRSRNSNDIMFRTYEVGTNRAIQDYISNEFTDTDAYYLELIDSAQDVTDWGLGVPVRQR